MVQSKVLMTAAIAAMLAISSTTAYAARVASDSAEVPDVEAVLDSAALSSRSQVPLRSLSSRNRPSQSSSAVSRPQDRPAAKRRGPVPSRAIEKDKGPAGPDNQITLRGRKITVLSDEDAGVEFFCRDLRRRLWVQERGWVVRVVRSCF
jgi:hypothetical protein